MEAKKEELKAWAQVHKVKFSFDEHNLKLKVKVTNEAREI
jgi:tRNA(Ile)-lysidine synthase TilS/MesJ